MCHDVLGQIVDACRIDWRHLVRYGGSRSYPGPGFPRPAPVSASLKKRKGPVVGLVDPRSRLWEAVEFQGPSYEIIPAQSRNDLAQRVKPRMAFQHIRLLTSH